MIDLPPLPFFAPPDRLPAPLPSKEAIAAATDVVKESTGRRVVRIGPFLVKYGGNVTVTEGENMLFVSQFSSSISIPKVYAVYNEIGSNINYIVMENVEGRTLESCRTELDTDAKSTIAEKLREMMDRLRGLPYPGYYGSIGHRALEDSMFWTAESIPAINGPFETEVELFEALVQKYLYNTSVPQKAEFYRRTLPRVLQNHHPVFSHADFQRTNVIVRKDGSPTIIDWETAGGYPDYWDYTLAMFACGSWDDDWHSWVAKILDEYLNEYVWMDMLRRELWS